MAMGCQLCEGAKEGTAEIVITEGTKRRGYWTCLVCRLAVDISHRTGVDSKASLKLEALEARVTGKTSHSTYKGILGPNGEVIA